MARTTGPGTSARIEPSEVTGSAPSPNAQNAPKSWSWARIRYAGNGGIVSYSEQIPYPSGALNPSQGKQEQRSDGLNWWQWLLVLIVIKIVVVVLLAKYRPDLLRKLVEKLGIHFGGSGMPGESIRWDGSEI